MTGNSVKDYLICLIILPTIVMIIYLIIRLRKRKIYPLPMDEMEGHDFEYYCADLLRKDGFSNVEVTKGSGDFGVDILA